MKKYEVAVFIGRFSPLHNAHVETIQRGLEIADRVIVFVGSANAARNIRSPWTYAERAGMIKRNFLREWERVTTTPLNDHLYNDNAWVSEVQSRLSDVKGKIALIGANKDETTYYLSMFPMMERVETEVKSGFHSTIVREKLYTALASNYVPKLSDTFSDMISDDTSDWIEEWCKAHREQADRLSREYYFIRNYKTAWSTSPYPPTFVTVDAVVVCAGHFLAVRRKAAPGEGLIALPGGFIGQHERLIDACVRELREETKLKVPAPVIKGSLKDKEVFDHPRRSLRGRTITHAFYFELADTTLPKVKGGDDAADAFWVPLSDLSKLQTEIYEDHAHIIEYFTGVTL